MNTSVVTARIATVAALILVGSGCQGPTEYVTVRQAGPLVVYEGLPHQMYDEAAFKEELKAKPTTTLNDYPFYTQSLDVKEPDREALREILGAHRTYESFSGEKKCGGFHPDYAVVWSVGGAAYRTLICFGCGEIKVIGPKGEARYDVARDARKRLQAILSPYRANRPPHESFGTLDRTPDGRG